MATAERKVLYTLVAQYQILSVAFLKFTRTTPHTCGVWKRENFPNLPDHP